MKELLKLSTLPESAVDALDQDSGDIGKSHLYLSAVAVLNTTRCQASLAERRKGEARVIRCGGAGTKNQRVSLCTSEVLGPSHLPLHRFDHFTAPVEDATIHFVHQRSPRPDAIPLLILHGWPGLFRLPLPCGHYNDLHSASGLFYDFHKIIKVLANPDDPAQPAFHVVAPSLPGYAWSTLPRKKDFSLDDTARIFNTLMTQTLGYKEYVGQGGDWVRSSFIILRSHLSYQFIFFRDPISCDL